jgi:hypothetical protein
MTVALCRLQNAAFEDSRGTRKSQHVSEKLEETEESVAAENIDLPERVASQRETGVASLPVVQGDMFCTPLRPPVSAQSIRRRVINTAYSACVLCASSSVSPLPSVPPVLIPPLLAPPLALALPMGEVLVTPTTACRLPSPPLPPLPPLSPSQPTLLSLPLMPLLLPQLPLPLLLPTPTTLLTPPSTPLPLLPLPSLLPLWLPLLPPPSPSPPTATSLSLSPSTHLALSTVTPTRSVLAPLPPPPLPPPPSPRRSSALARSAGVACSDSKAKESFVVS